MLDDERYRGELIRRATTPLSIAGALWLVAELTRLIVAAAALAAVLVLLGWRNRTIWLPAARTHRTTAVVSRSRSLVELAVMAAALAMAAGLAATG
jgi:hypothetical protein